VDLAFWAGVIGSVGGLSNLVAAPLLGRLSDRIGELKILIFSLTGTALLFFPQAFALGVWDLALYRFLQGIFIGGLAPAVNSLMRSYTPDEMVSRTYATNSSMMSMGNLIGPIIGGFISGYVGIGGVFIFCGVLFVIITVIFWNMLVRDKKKSRAH
jgi:MFS family permease